MNALLLSLALLVQAPDAEVPSEVMPAVTSPTTLEAADLAPIPPPPARHPWVDPDEVGAASPYAQVLVAQWGFGIGHGGLPLTLSDYMLGASASTNAVTNTLYVGAGGPVDWRETRIHGIPDTNIKWGTRAFDTWGWDFYRCSWDTISKEHGCYFNATGGLSWVECTFGGEGAEEITGQAIQVVYAYPGSKRAHETGYTDSRAWLRLVNSTVRDETHRVESCAVTNVGKPLKSERASFALSFFEPLGTDGIPGHEVRILRCYIETSDPWIDQNGVQRDCTGAIMVHKRRHATIRQNFIGYRLGDRDVMQLWAVSDGLPGTPDVVITENYIDAKQPIDIRLGNVNDTIIISRNVGNAEVIIHTNPWYVWGNNGWDESKVLYRGPVGRNFRYN